METNLKFNSAICTTREQSERLLSLGLKKETADMSILTNQISSDGIINSLTPYKELIYPKVFGAIPAWSLNRLIEMYHKTCIFWTDCIDNPYEAMVCRIADKIRRGEFNKEYLKE